MPSIVADLKSLEHKSIVKIEEQLNYMKYQRPSGLLNGWQSENGEEEAKQSPEICSNTSIQWLNGTLKQRETEISEIPMCCETCVTLSYAGSPISLRLVFTPRQPWMPPDILLFTNDGFMDILTLETVQQKLSTLSRWSEGKKESVAELVSELYLLYKDYNLAKLQHSSPDMWEQYKLFEKELQLTDTDIEVLINGSERIICVQLPIHFEELPQAVFPEGKGVARCVLQLSANDDSNQFRSYLHMSPRAESLLEGDVKNTTFKLDPVPFGSKSLVTYTSSVICQVQDRIKKCLFSFEMKKQVVAQLLCQYEAAISQYDKNHFSSIELLLQEDDFHYLVDIKFPHGFPQLNAPLVYLRSISQEESEEQVSYKIPHVSHLPTNDPEEIMQSVLNASKTYCRNLKKSCT